jgi:Ca2+-binding RTX toxin-like protein
LSGPGLPAVAGSFAYRYALLCNDEVESFGIGSSGVTAVLGAGNDRCDVSGPATVLGGAGADTITDSSGNDVLYGEAGNDVVHGRDGDDFVHGGAGHDVLDGGNHTDRIDARDGVFGNDHIDSGNDVVGTDTAWIDFSFDDGYDYIEGIEVLHLN